MAGTSQKRRANFSSSSSKSKRTKRAFAHLNDERWHLNLGTPTTLGGKGIDSRKCPPGLNTQEHIQRQINKFDQQLAVDYAIHFKGNFDAWRAPAMRSYSKFELPEQTRIAVNDIVYVRHDDSNPWDTEADSGEQAGAESDSESLNEHEAHVNGSKAGPVSSRRQDLKKKTPGRRNSKDWVAQILECRAASSAAVYLRVFWLYRPDDLPDGAQPHHGRDEVVPSNHMEIIEAATVQGTVEGLVRWNEYDDESEMNSYEGLIWRQTYNYLTNKLTPLRKYCVCKQAAKPEETMIECINPECGIWMHHGCIAKEARREFARRTVAGTLDSGPADHGDTSDHPSTPIIEVRPRSEIITVTRGEDKENEAEAEVEVEAEAEAEAERVDDGDGEVVKEEDGVEKESRESMMNKIGTKMGRWFASHVNSSKATPSVDGRDTSGDKAIRSQATKADNGTAESGPDASTSKVETPTIKSDLPIRRARASRKTAVTKPATPVSQKKGRRRRTKEDLKLEAAEREWTATVSKRDGSYLVHLTRTVDGEEVEQRWEKISCLQCHKELS